MAYGPDSTQHRALDAEIADTFIKFEVPDYYQLVMCSCGACYVLGQPLDELLHDADGNPLCSYIKLPGRPASYGRYDICMNVDKYK